MTIYYTGFGGDHQVFYYGYVPHTVIGSFGPDFHADDYLALKAVPTMVQGQMKHKIRNWKVANKSAGQIWNLLFESEYRFIRQ